MRQEARYLIEKDAVAAADLEDRPILQFAPERENQPYVVLRRRTGFALRSFELEPVNLFIERMILASSVLGGFRGEDLAVEVPLQKKNAHQCAGRNATLARVPLKMRKSVGG